jgi:hypothetical protein
MSIDPIIDWGDVPLKVDDSLRQWVTNYVEKEYQRGRAEALEEAAQIADSERPWTSANEIADAIRARAELSEEG